MESARIAAAKVVFCYARVPVNDSFMTGGSGLGISNTFVSFSLDSFYIALVIFNFIFFLI